MKTEAPEGYERILLYKESVYLRHVFDRCSRRSPLTSLVLHYQLGVPSLGALGSPRELVVGVFDLIDVD